MELILEKKIIKENIKLNNVSHAYLIEGSHSQYTEDFVYDFAKQLLYEEDEISTEEFLDLLEQNLILDLKIIRPDKSMIKKEQLLDLQKEFSNKSVQSKKRVYIIFEAEQLNQSSGNSILKFLEEPKDGIIAILVTNNRYKILPTIISRCRVISLNNEEESRVSASAEKLTSYILDPESLFLKQNEILNEIMVDKQQAKTILKEVEYYLFDLYKRLLSGENMISIIDKNIEENGLPDKILKYIAIIEENFEKMTYNINYKLWLDSFLIELKGVK